jgi:hypothetical protein
MSAHRSAFLTGASGFIGTNLVSALLHSGWRVINYDSAPPLNSAHRPNHREGNILNGTALSRALTDARPDVVVHLAARTDCHQKATIDDYRTNTEGTQNVLDAIKRTASVRRAIITSSQYVCGPGRLPSSDTDYFPNTTYGLSKVFTEKLTRSADLPCAWILMRPVNIWGPYHMRYAREFWEVVRHGWYFTPIFAVQCDVTDTSETSPGRSSDCSISRMLRSTEGFSMCEIDRRPPIAGYLDFTGPAVGWNREGFRQPPCTFLPSPAMPSRPSPVGPFS